MKNEVRVLVSGDREWDEPFIMGIVLDGLLSRYQERLVIIEGDARGADKMAGEWAIAHGLTVENNRLRVYPADWDLHKKAAGPIRNRTMLRMETPQMVIGFHNDITKSKGTKDCLEEASRRKIYTALIGAKRVVVPEQMTLYS